MASVSAAEVEREMMRAFSSTNGGLPVGVTDAVLQRMYPEPHPLADKPVQWVEERLGGYLWSKQQEIMRSVRANRYTAVPSCHGVGKSFVASAIIAHAVDTAAYVGEVMVVFTAPRWKQVAGIVGKELRLVHARAGLDGRVTLDMKWYDGDDVLVAEGRKPADNDESGFQGTHARVVIVVVDEAGGVHPSIWTGVDTLMTNDLCRAVALGNPDDPSAEFNEVCKPGSGWNVIPIDGLLTPNFTKEVVEADPVLKEIFEHEGVTPVGEYIPERLKPMLMGPTWLKERVKRYGYGTPRWESKVRGRFPKITKDTLINPGLINSAHNLELPGIKLGRLGVDIARFGTDSSLAYWNRGGQIRRVGKWSKQNTHQTSCDVREILELRPGVGANIDTIGVGSGVFDNLDAWGFDVTEYIASAQASEPDRFVNLRAEAYWNFREAMEEDLIDLDPEDDELAAELGAIKFKFVNKRIQIEDKDALRRRIGKSPDHADAAVMSWWEGADFDIDESDSNEGESMTNHLMEQRF